VNTAYAHNEIVAGQTTGSPAAVFMAEPGDLEWQSILLTCSLKAFACDDLSIWAYCRENLVDQLHPNTLAFFQEQGVTLRSIAPKFDVPYPQGNKLYACADQRSCDATILFDTDMFLVTNACLSDTLHEGHVCGRKTGNWMWGETLDEWRSAYASVGLDLPRHRMARHNNTYVTPSISAGFVAYKEPDFGQVWTDVALEIESKRMVEGMYPTLDQISLPVAVTKAGMSIKMIETKWNYAGLVGNVKSNDVIGYHYQKLERLADSPYVWIANSLIEDFTSFQSIESLIDFYMAEGSTPAEVSGNPGYDQAVSEKQRQVDVPFGRYKRNKRYRT